MENYDDLESHLRNKYDSVKFLLPALNQIYSFFPSKNSSGLISFRDVFEFISKDITGFKNDESGLKEKNDNNCKIEITEFKKYLCKFNDNFKMINWEYLEVFKNSIMYIYLEKEFIEYEKAILSHLLNEVNDKLESFNFVFIEKETLKVDFISNSLFFIFLYAYDIHHFIDKNVLEYKNVFLVSINNLNLNYFELDNNKNEILKRNFDIHNKYDKYFQFDCINFMQHYHFYVDILDTYNKEICQNKLFEKESIINIVMKNKIIVLVLHRSLSKSKDFDKFKFCISRNDVFYKFHIGGDNVDINYPFNLILNKLGKIKDSIVYSKLIENLGKYSKNNSINSAYLLNSFNKMEYFHDKYLMLDMIKDTVNNYKNLSNKCKIVYTKYKILKSKDNIGFTNNDTRYFKQFISDISFPIIIKYGNNNIDKYHTTIFCRSEENLKELILIDNEDIIMQEYIKSEFVLKLYRINGKTYVFKRKLNPSFLNNLNDNLIHIENRSIEKVFIIKKPENLCYLKDDELENIEINQYEDRSEFNIIASIFEENYKINLFGLDFVYNNDNYYFIDCNFFPGYKELINSISSLIRNHCYIYYKKYNQK